MSSDYDSAPINNLDLTQFDDDFTQAEVEEREFDEVPDGKYQVLVEKAELVRAQSSGSPMIKWTLKILGPQCAGRRLWRNSVFGKKENMKWLKTDLHTCGVDLERASDLPGRLKDLLDVTLEVTKRTKGENSNIFFDKRIVIDRDDTLTPF